MKAVLGLGSNLGDRENYLKEAKEMLLDYGIILKESSIIETKPFGVSNQPFYLNQVLIFETIKKPLELLKLCNNIEKKLERIRVKKWESRTIDIDILFYENEIIETEILQIPHIGIAERDFVLRSLIEIIPEFIHPVYNKSILQLYTELKNK